MDIFGDDTNTASNLTEFTVSELSGSIKRTVETAFDHVRVRGEISGYRGPHSSGHAYFALKDDKSRIDAVVWKGAFSKLKYRPEEGMEVIATGRITTFPGSSKYQIVIEQMEPAGAGALMALLEERKRRFEAEGLFALARKKPLPFLPRVIGVVTSPTGAVIRDILHRIQDRFPVHVIVWPVKVQGEGSGDEVANAIAGFNALPENGPIARPDVLIVARGGGSLEDLWSFNDEAVVRAAAASQIPLISAVGHETDTTLIDYAADMRAPTPTGAAEMAVPVRADLNAQMASLAARLSGAMSRQMDLRQQTLRALMRALPSLDQLLALPRRRFDEAASGLGRGLELNTMTKRRLFEKSVAKLQPDILRHKLNERRQHLQNRSLQGERLIERLIERHKTRLGRFDATLASLPLRLKTQVSHQRERLVGLAQRADSASSTELRRLKSALAAHDRVLQSLSYRNVLQRGFAVVRDEGGKILARASAVTVGQPITIEFADQTIDAKPGEDIRRDVGEGAKASAPMPAISQTTAKPSAPKPRKTEPPTGQGSLF